MSDFESFIPKSLEGGEEIIEFSDAEINAIANEIFKPESG